MTDVYWLEQSTADVPARDDWLAEGEAFRLSGLRIAKRRNDWLLGRWTAKLALAAYLDLPGDAGSLARIEIRSAASGAPEAYLHDRAAGPAISLTHRAGRAICAVAMADAALGCDLEIIEPRSFAFIADYFTTGEQVALGRVATSDRSRMITLVWSAKESALKALQTGLRSDTRSVEVNAGSAVGGHGSDWRPLFVRCTSGQMFQGWWQSIDDFLMTMVSSPAAGPPVRLKNSFRAA